MSIVYYPSEILLQKTKEISFAEYGVDKIKALKKQMVEEMINHEGIGLAANQIGLDIRVFVMYLVTSINQESIILINPEIIKRGKEMVSCSEGCLSFPNVKIEKKRNKIVTIKYINEDGVETERVFKGIEAVCAQHEIDHLDGKTFADDLPQYKKDEIIDDIKKFIKNKDS